jgi:BMFP domain-containing protein YqiC
MPKVIRTRECDSFDEVRKFLQDVYARIEVLEARISELEKAKKGSKKAKKGD